MEIDECRKFHNYKKRLRRTTFNALQPKLPSPLRHPLTQARLKAKPQRKHYGQANVDKWIPSTNKQATLNMVALIQINLKSVSEMRVS